MRGNGRRSAVMGAVWVAALLVIWETAARSGAVSPLLLPTVPETLRRLVSGLLQGELLRQLALSLGIICLGLALALLLGLALSLLAQWNWVLASLSDTLCMLAHPLPAVALMPLLIIWFGTGLFAVGAMVVHSVLWPILLNLSAGFRGADRLYVEMGKTLGLGPLATLWHVYLPAASAHLIAGLKIGWARAWRALISAEMIFGAVGGSGGIGWFLFRSRVLMDTPGLYAGILVVITVGVAVEALLNLLERRTAVRWGMSAG